MVDPIVNAALRAEYEALGLQPEPTREWPVKPTPIRARPIVRQTEPGPLDHDG